jgi:hypothetical protein
MEKYLHEICKKLGCTNCTVINNTAFIRGNHFMTKKTCGTEVKPERRWCCYHCSIAKFETCDAIEEDTDSLTFLARRLMLKEEINKWNKKK